MYSALYDLQSEWWQQGHEHTACAALLAWTGAWGRESQVADSQVGNRINLFNMHHSQRDPHPNKNT
jgi:hypothetical protein